MKKVSIIIPIYNVASFVEECLMSALSQTYSNIEYIIVDDCGTDNSIELVSTIVSKSNRRTSIKIVSHNRNLGLSEARNTGIWNSTGDYLYFLDSDDYITPNAIELMVAFVEKYSPDFVIANMKLFGNDKNIDFLHTKEDVIETNISIALAYSESKWYMMACNKLISREFILENNMFFYPRIYHEDELWSLKLALFANTMAICHEYTYFYRINSSSITGHISEKHIRDLCVVIDESMRLLSENQNICLYSRVRTLYLKVLTNLSNTNFTSDFRLDILNRLSYLRKPLSEKINIRPFVVKSFVKSMVCLIPVRLLFWLVKYVRIWA